MICESVNNIEAAGIPHDCQHEFFLWISSLDFVTTSSLDNVHMRRGDILKKNQDSASVTRWCQASRSVAYKNGNMALAYSFRFSHKPPVKRSGTQCKWNDLNPRDSCKCCNTVE
jgi:hypothetical protein